MTDGNSDLRAACDEIKRLREQLKLKEEVLQAALAAQKMLQDENVRLRKENTELFQLAKNALNLVDMSATRTEQALDQTDRALELGRSTVEMAGAVTLAATSPKGSS